jgi:hypothetical protein
VGDTNLEIGTLETVTLPEEDDSPKGDHHLEIDTHLAIEIIYREIEVSLLIEIGLDHKADLHLDLIPLDFLDQRLAIIATLERDLILPEGHIPP